MKKYALETTVGMFVLIGLVCVAYLTIKLGKLEIVGGDTYAIKARFKDVTGLKSGAYGGNGRRADRPVSGINLDPKSNMPIVSLDIQNGIKLTDDAMASIKTSGLIGDKFVKVSPGGSDDVLKPGGMIVETESSVDLGDLIGKYVFGGVK